MRSGYDLSVETISKIARGLRRDGRIIGFTHGAFDMFHYGHLYLLERTAAKCDYLVVGIESDENIRNYKAVERPIVNEDERMDIIESLRCVSAAFIQEGPVADKSYSDLYTMLDPHFISIGRDFRFKERIENRTRKMGIGLEMFYYGGNRSTTQLVDSILSRYSKKKERELEPGEEFDLCSD